MKVTSDDYEIKYVNNVTGGGSKVVGNNTVAVGASIVVIAKGNYEASKTVDDNSTSPATTVKMLQKRQTLQLILNCTLPKKK